MNFVWIGGGILLLCVTLCIKALADKEAYQVVAYTFAMTWSALAAVHFWTFFYQQIYGLPVPGLTHEGRVAVVAYWIAFLAAALPNFLLLSYYIKGHSVAFPWICHRAMVWAGSGMIVASLICLLLMSLTLFSPNTRNLLPPGTWGRKAHTEIRRLPVQAYLNTSGETLPAFNERHSDGPIPTPVARILFAPERGGPRP